MDERLHRVSQALDKVGPVYSTKDEKQRILAEEILNLRFKPKVALNVNPNIQGLDKKKVIGFKNPSTIRLFRRASGVSKNGNIHFATYINISRFAVPVFVFAFYFYNCMSFTHATYYKLEKNNYEIEFCYRKLGTTSIHYGEKLTLMA